METSAKNGLNVNELFCKIGMTLYNYPVIRYSIIGASLFVLLLYRKKILHFIKKIREGLHEK
jgi:hypothetical protein